MSDELTKLLGEETQTPVVPSDDKSKENELIAKEESRLSNVRKAIEEANAQLRERRKALKDAKSAPEEELPKIDLEDPNSKAWDKHFSSKVNPLEEEMAKEKEEVRTYALNEFLQDYPSLSSSPEALKRVMGTYEKIRTASERTREGVLIDLKRAYAAEFSDEILSSQNRDRVSRAQGEAIFSDAAVSRGSTSYRTEREKTPRLSREDEAILAKWNLTPEEWVKMKQAQEKK